MQKYFSDSVWVNFCPLFPVPCSLFPTTAAKSNDYLAREVLFNKSIILYQFRPPVSGTVKINVIVWLFNFHSL
ncbi:MAG: hypothetical protein F6K56_15490 [Moorea sp. SIO3G5]|nr:hypothetical protein [Moorena sp. SIO3G5]